MKTPLLLIALFLCGQAYGYLIPLSGFRSVSASGIAGSISGGGQSSYSETESLTGPLGAFDGSVSGFADRKDTVPSSYGRMGSYHAESAATQTSIIAVDQISVTASLWGSTRVSLAGPYGPADSSASSVFEVTFDVLDPLAYQLDASRILGWHAMPPPNLNFSLTSAHQGAILSNTSLTGANHFSGILFPDNYTLRFNADIFAVADPLGDFKYVEYSMNLRVTPVPDAGSTGALLAMAFAGLILVRRMSNRNTGHRAVSV